MIKLFRCPRCKDILKRDVARNTVRVASFCCKSGKQVTMRRVKVA